MPVVSTQAEPPLLGRHAVVTGAGRGIGSATARELARLGATLTLMGRTAEPLERLAADLPRMAGRPDPHVELLDVTEPTTVQSAFEHAVGERGPVHVLVNNAGGVESAPFRRTD